MPAPFGYVSNNCPLLTPLGVGASCQLHFTFAPTVIGTPSGQVTVTINGVAHQVMLSGSGVGATVPTSLDFGPAGVGDLTTKTLTITNNSAVVLGPLDVDVGTPTSNRFTLEENDCDAVLLSTPGGSCILTFGITPNSTGLVSGTVPVTVNGVTTTVSLSGKRCRVLRAVLAQLRQHRRRAGAEDGRPQRHEHQHGQPAAAHRLVGLADRAVRRRHRPLHGAHPHAWHSCQLDYTYAPTLLGPASQNVNLFINGVAYPISLTGTGVGVAVANSLAFNNAGVGDGPKSGQLNVTNGQSFALGPLNVSVGAITGPFAYISHNCPTATQLGAGALVHTAVHLHADGARCASGFAHGHDQRHRLLRVAAATASVSPCRPRWRSATPGSVIRRSRPR